MKKLILLLLTFTSYMQASELQQAASFDEAVSAVDALEQLNAVEAEAGPAEGADGFLVDEFVDLPAADQIDQAKLQELADILVQDAVGGRSGGHTPAPLVTPIQEFKSAPSNPQPVILKPLPQPKPRVHWRQCPYCEKAYKQIKNLQQHVRDKHITAAPLKS